MIARALTYACARDDIDGLRMRAAEFTEHLKDERQTFRDRLDRLAQREQSITERLRMVQQQDADG